MPPNVSNIGLNSCNPLNILFKPWRGGLESLLELQPRNPAAGYYARWQDAYSAFEAELRAHGGAEAEVAGKLVFPAEPEGTTVNNLQLVHLNEANLLDNVRSRFESQQIYTYTGQLELLAVHGGGDGVAVLLCCTAAASAANASLTMVAVGLLVVACR